MIVNIVKKNVLFTSSDDTPIVISSQNTPSIAPRSYVSYRMSVHVNSSLFYRVPFFWGGKGSKKSQGTPYPAPLPNGERDG